LQALVSRNLSDRERRRGPPHPASQHLPVLRKHGLVILVSREILHLPGIGPNIED
jgi:hypothetical protein